MSRPEKEIDWDKVDKLMMSGCTGTEIAPHFDIHHETLYNRLSEKYGMGFTEYSRKMKCYGDSILRTKQYEKALTKDNGMMIWLGKQRLGQTDQVKTIHSFDGELKGLLDLLKSLKPKEPQLVIEIKDKD